MLPVCARFTVGSELSDKFGGAPSYDVYASVPSTTMTYGDRPYNYQPSDDLIDLKAGAQGIR